MDKTYKVMTETLEDCAYIPAFGRLLGKYPNLKNIYYGWADGNDANTDLPPQLPDNPMNVLTNVWKTINYMKPGTYMIAARNERILNIYHKRWLKSNQWKVLESGVMFGDTPYHIMKKEH